MSKRAAGIAMVVRAHEDGRAAWRNHKRTAETPPLYFGIHRCSSWPSWWPLGEEWMLGFNAERAITGEPVIPRLA